MKRNKVVQNPCLVTAKFHYMGPTGPDQTKSADFVGDPGLRPGSREKVRAGPRGSGLARVVEFSLTRQSRSVQLDSRSVCDRLCRAINSRTRATKSRDKIARVTSV